MNWVFPTIKNNKIIFLFIFIVLLSIKSDATQTPNPDQFLLKVDYIQDANSITLSSGKKIRLAGVQIPDFYGKNSSWIGLDEKQMYAYSMEAKEFVNQLLYITEEKKKWYFFRTVTKSQRVSRPIYVELEMANSKKKHKAYKKSKEVLAYVYVLLPDDDSGSDDIQHYALLPDANYKKKRVCFVNEALLKQGYGWAYEPHAKSQYNTLKTAEEFATQHQTPGKSASYEKLRLKANIKSVEVGEEYQPKSIPSGYTIYLENGLRVPLLGTITPEPRAKNAHFTAPYGNLLSVASQRARSKLEELLHRSGEPPYKTIHVQLDPQELRRKKRKGDLLYAWVYSERNHRKYARLNQCCGNRAEAGALVPDWVTQEESNFQMLNLEMLLAGLSYPLKGFSSQYQTLFNDAFEYARLQKINFHSDEFEALNFISDLTKTTKGKNAPTKYIGTPRRRVGGDNNSWLGKSNFNG